MKRSLLWTLAAAAGIAAGCGEKEGERGDADGDGYTADDCDDADAAVNPGAAEECNALDDNCDGAIDEGLPEITSYLDSDGDGAGSDASPGAGCAVADGYAAVGGDCDDGDPSAYPGAAEGCDGADNDCDGAVDDDVADAPTWYSDGDGDGYGNDEYSLVQCDQPEGEGSTWTDQSGDCADEDPSISPGTDEVCGDAIDNNCDTQVDENLIPQYLDIDQDGYGQTAVLVEACELSPGFALEGGDCADIDEQRHPGATEVCGDAIDNNCDAETDESCGEEGSWTVWTGYETFDYGYTAEPGDRSCHLYWETNGAPSAAPCPDCDFVFEVLYTYDASKSEDDGSCEKLAVDSGPYTYGYQADYNGSPAIMLGYYDAWYYWFGVDSFDELDGALIYHYGLEDYYYKGGYYTYWQYGQVNLD